MRIARCSVKVAIVISSLAVSFSLSIDCQNMNQFAYDVGIPLNQPNIWSEIQNDCCNTSGITCNNQRVTQIDWPFMNLNGSINGTAIPPRVYKLYLNNNFLNGNIPSKLPSVLQYLALDSNRLTGDIPPLLPEGLLMLHLNVNNLIGDLPAFPSTLKNIRLGSHGQNGNHFTGTLSLNQPISFQVSYNWITDLIVLDISELTIGCDISYNPLLGNTKVAELTMCTQNGLYSAALLPITRSTIVRTTISQKTTILYPFIQLHSGSSQFITAAATASMEWTRDEAETFTYDSFVPLIHIHSILEFFKLGIKLLLNMSMIAYVLCKTPWSRELKNKVQKWKTARRTGGMLLTA